MKQQIKGQFSAAHRENGQFGKDASLHGHNFGVFVTIKGDQDYEGKMIDPQIVRDILIQYDHITFLSNSNSNSKLIKELEYLGSKIVLYNCEPSIENICNALKLKITKALPEFEVYVRIWDVQDHSVSA